LPVFEIIKDGDKEEEREKEHKDIMPEEAGEIYHIRRKSKKQRSEERLFLIKISNAIDTIYERDEKNSKE
jgi:hypothetical protein